MAFAVRGASRADRRFEMRLSDEEYQRLRELADDAALTASEFARRRILGVPTRSATDEMTVRELRRLGGLQKLTIKRGIVSCEIVEECVRTIKALREAIERVATSDHQAR